jgi:hypothetical protein
VRWLALAIVAVTVSTVRADKPMTTDGLADAIAVSRDGKRLVLPIQHMVDSAFTRSTTSVLVVDLGAATGKTMPLSHRDSAMPDGGVDEAADGKNAKAIDKVLADGGFTPLALAKPGKEIAPKLTVELVPGKGTSKIVASLAKQPVGSSTIRGRGSVEMMGAVRVSTTYIYALVRWSTSSDGGAAVHDDEWVAIAITK